jgi:hypothetical protein
MTDKEFEDSIKNALEQSKKIDFQKEKEENYKRFLEDFGETLKKAEEIVEEVKNDPNNKYNFHLVSPQESRTDSIALIINRKNDDQKWISLTCFYNLRTVLEPISVSVIDWFRPAHLDVSYDLAKPKEKEINDLQAALMVPKAALGEVIFKDKYSIKYKEKAHMDFIMKIREEIKK